MSQIYSVNINIFAYLFSSTSFDKHMLNVCKTCFFWLRQLRRVRHSLDVESVGLCFWRVVGWLLQLSCEESQTSCSLFWMLQHVWSLGLRSTSEVCHG